MQLITKLGKLLLGCLIAGALLAPTLVSQEQESQWRIVLKDFVDAAGQEDRGESFLARLRPGPEQDEVSKYLFEQLGKAAKDLILEEQNYPYLLKEDDIRDPVTLLRQLRLNENPVSAHLFSKLKPETQELIKREGSTFAPGPELKDALRAGLNELLQQGLLYDAVRLNVRLSEETKRLSAMPSAGQQAVRLNRLLLEDAYNGPSEIMIKRSSVELFTLRDLLLQELKTDLNKLLNGGRSLAEESCFRNLALSATTKTLLQQQPAGERLVMLNRHLLQDAYPKEIARRFELILQTSTGPLPLPAPTPVTRPVSATPTATPAPTPEVPLDPRPFYAALQRFKVALPPDCQDETGQRIAEEYGAVFVARGVVPPTRCLFANEAEVEEFQRQAGAVRWRGIILQGVALDYLGRAMRAGAQQGLRITPRGPDAARRSFDDTVRNWNSRFLPALAHWVQRGKITPQRAAEVRALPFREQAAAVLQWEAEGLYFSKDLAKSILYSVAVPGSSQHIAMLALDIEEFRNSRVRAVLAQYGWFQTVKSDLPHFTFLGAPEADLPLLGLRAEVVDGQKFWVPDMTPRN